MKDIQNFIDFEETIQETVPTFKKKMKKIHSAQSIREENIGTSTKTPEESRRNQNEGKIKIHFISEDLQ